MPSFPGQQTQMAIMTCRFCVSENDHRNPHEDQASSCLHMKPSSWGVVLFLYLNISNTFNQTRRRPTHGSGLPRLLKNLHSCKPRHVEGVSTSTSNVATGIGLSIEDGVNMCCYWVHLFQRCGEYNDVSQNPHSKEHTRLKSWWYLAFRNEHGEELWEADWNYLYNL